MYFLKFISGKAVRLRSLGVLLLLIGSQLAQAIGFPEYPDDPLGTHDAVSNTPARATETAGKDPCMSTGPKPERWSLVDVIDQALCHNPQTRQAWANARQQASHLGVAESGYLPSFNFNLPISRSQNTAGGGITNGVPVTNGGGRAAQYTRVVPTLSVNYLLFDFGGRAARVEQARQALEAANWQHAQVIQNVLFSAIQYYYQYFAAQASMDAAVQTERSTRKAFDSAAYRFEVGAAALGDKLQAQTTWSQAKVNLKTAEGTAKSALGALATVMGLKPHEKMVFESPNLEGPIEEREKNIEELIDLAKSSRPDLAAAEALVKADEASVLNAKSTGMPNLSLVGNYANLDSIGYSNISSWAVGVQVSIPLFTGFSNSYQVKSAEEQVEEDAAARDQIEQQIAQNVWQTYYTLNATRDNLKNTEDLLKSAVDAEKVAHGRYDEGVGNIVELMNAESNLANARYQFVQAHFNWRIGKAQLAQALGRLDVGDVDAVEGAHQNRLAN